ncbi:MAG: DMT family transporter, partial [Pseudomonadota bacterium]
FATLFLGLALLVGGVAGVEVLLLTMPDQSVWPLIALLAVLGTVGQGMMTFAAKFAEASLIAPFQYIEIVSATILGYILFQEFPDALTWLGAAIILTAGLYTIHRERRLARGRRPAVPLG